MTARSIRHRLSEATNIWPGFVDVLATLLIVIIFILMVFTVSQIYLSDAISGRDKALEDLRNQINELSKILVIESKEKQQALEDLSTTESELQSEQELTLRLESEIAESKATISTQSINISVLSDQIENLLVELRIVAKALETYEGIEVTSLDTKGLGERINKALAARIDQLNLMNEKLSLSQQETAKQLQIVYELNENLMAINESLGLDDAGLVEQLEAIRKKNTELALANEQLEFSKQQISEQLKIVEELNAKLTLNEEELQNQVMQYQKLTEELIALNDSLDIKDQTLIEKIELIRNKNTKLALLNEELIKKDTTIFDLRGKILELNNILSISKENKIAQQAEIQSLSQKISVLETESAKSADQKTQIESLTSKIASLEKENQQLIDSTDKEILEAQLKSSSTLEQVAFLTNEIEVLKNEINILNSALEASEQDVLTKELKIEVLGERLNKALTSKVFELQKYRSEFFGRLKSILGDRQDIKVVGDRFIFESELLFDSGSASLQLEGKEKLKQIGLTLKETTMNIPDDIDWIIQVEGHTDKNPINTPQFPSNWELSTARANTVLKLLLELGFNPQHLSAAGYGEFYPISKGKSAKDLQQNRRIELKLTSR
ncbi:MAG TPA: OmpA family protein [Alphaproteobacteria bacterium]|nr:OmpA family protein [Pelagibacteraceae bacterium]HJL58061.1 OmpA family protein [Alphaproteobacteria bacterium]HJO14391.1 OmpA family protein [Alphaproteobacteria bacterium]